MLNDLRKRARNLFNKAKKNGSWDSYREALTNYNKAIRKSKRESWRKYCSDIEETPHAARLHKALNKSQTADIGLLKKPDGSFTQSHEDTLLFLLQEHFPGSSPVQPECTHVDEYYGTPHWRNNAISGTIFSPDKVRWAISSFEPFKAPGLDGILPIHLQQGLE